LRTHDYNNDPYFYTAPTYRYTRAGRTYQTNRYGADLLKQSINRGYQEGVQAGQADRQDRYRGNYQSTYAYQDANVGYTGMYVDQGEYNYYFRQGFQRGYQDGYNARTQFGQSNNGGGILANVLSAILSLQSLQ
jgi:flagellar biosynthesis/type III secretory pathway protein FliH